MVVVRPIGPDRWELWRSLRLSALADAPEAFAATLADWTGPHDREARWRHRLERVPLNLVAEVDGEPAGMASATAPDEENAVELLSLWVPPARRGAGVADALVDEVARWARARARADRLVAVVRVANEHAVALYERHGFRDTGWATEPTATFPERRMVLVLH